MRDGEDTARHAGSSDPATPPDHSLGFLLPRVAHSLDRAFEEMLTAYDLRGAHLGVLSTLRAYGPLPQRRIAEYLGLERQTLVNVTDDLERLEAVERRPWPDDRRAQALHLTTVGRDLHDRADAAAEEHQRRVYGVLTADERATLARLLRKLAPGGHFASLFSPPLD